ncbi:PEP-CTERM sorting domain-containing protein [Roseiconus lacunae]|uniref:PEP-CTERM sorting domain-containing protein n=1 Tax=Roseiconus lacunae TaxID=2605694 RepID=UPI001E2F35D1|nr:PEP-CTERM sorting domain-containing protein [Roseiconus lacunae]MCD0461025.1 PEP-CTERM sorting domain-containing protein [Roseiconus lacunae]
MMLKRNYLILFAALVGIGLTTTHCSAELVITFGPQESITAGGNGKLDVFIRSDAAQSDYLSLFSAKFQIDTVTGGGLEFSTSPTDPHFQSPNYIFAGTTFDGLSSTVVNPQTIVAGDGTIAPTGYVIVPTDNRLLTTLEFDASQVAVGSQFQISLINDADTMFLDDGMLSTLPVAATSFSSSRLLSVTAVPEPSSAAVLGAVVAGMSLLRYRRRNTCRIRQGVVRRG